MADMNYDKFDGYAVFTMNRPDRLNALGGTMQSELTSALADFGGDPEDARGYPDGGWSRV